MKLSSLFQTRIRPQCNARSPVEWSCFHPFPFVYSPWLWGQFIRDHHSTSNVRRKSQSLTKIINFKDDQKNHHFCPCLFLCCKTDFVLFLFVEWNKNWHKIGMFQEWFSKRWYTDERISSQRLHEVERKVPFYKEMKVKIFIVYFTHTYLQYSIIRLIKKNSFPKRTWHKLRWTEQWTKVNRSIWEE